MLRCNSPVNCLVRYLYFIVKYFGNVYIMTFTPDLFLHIILQSYIEDKPINIRYSFDLEIKKKKEVFFAKLVGLKLKRK